VVDTEARTQLFLELTGVLVEEVLKMVTLVHRYPVMQLKVTLEDLLVTETLEVLVAITQLLVLVVAVEPVRQVTRE
jgi:hypothetical protein